MVGLILYGLYSMVNLLGLLGHAGVERREMFGIKYRHVQTQISVNWLNGMVCANPNKVRAGEADMTISELCAGQATKIV